MTVANAPRQEDPPARPDLTGLHLSGFGMERDSVSVALEAAASRLGRAADYERLYVRSGNAFAPAIATGESCRSWWHVQARAGTGNLPALAASLGLTAEPLVLPPRPAQDDPALAAWFRTAAAAAAAAMDSGAVLLSDGGWDEPGGWNWAGIVTEVGADGAIRGATLSAATGDGKEGVAWRYPGTLWAIRPGPPPTLPAAVDRATLRLAVERIRGTGVYAAREDLLFGLPAVDRWITAMKSDRGFCTDCFSRNPVPGVHDAPDNDRRLRAAALVVARNLRDGFSAMPPAARLALDQAANCYQRIAQYLSEPLDAKGFYDSLNSLEAQGIYAQRQLWRVRCELAAAADRFEEALQALEGRPRNLRLASDGRTRMLTLEGLASVTHADDPNWFGAGLSFAVKQIGVEADYHTLMGDLGTAFIMQASDRSPVNQGALDAGWWPLDPVGPRIFMAFAGRVHGFQAEFASSGSGAVDATAYRERFVPRIEAELRARRPCLGFIPCPNVITGLNPETGALLRVCPGTTTMPDFWETDPDARPWELVFLAPRTASVMPRPEADRQALRHALALMRDEVAMPWGYCSGAKAFATWAAALRDREHLGQHYWHGNVVRCLLQSRRAAVVYLEAMASRWPERAARNLRAAVGHYQAVIAACAEADTRETALTRPGEGRETLARLAERIAGLEVQAAAALEPALAEMGYTPDPDPVRLVLAGVPPVSFPGGAKNDGAPQMTCFPSCLGAVLRFLQEDFGSVEVDQRPLPPIHPMSPGESSTTLDKSYVLLMGATGAAFRLNWAPDWEPGSDLRWLSDDPWAPFRKGFEAAGRSFEVVEKHGLPDDERLFRQRIIASIRQGLPVIARGIIGPPEGCLVSGYDESGAVLTGWSFWQGDAKADPEVGFEPDGSFRKRAWFKDTESLLVLGERGPRPQPREQHRAALGWALQVMRTPVTHQTRANGIAAFDAWAEALRCDGEFDGQDLAGLKRRMVAHLVATDVIAEGRWYAHNYLKTAALDLPEVKDRLRQAAERCRDEHDLVWEMWRIGGSWQQLGEEAALRSFSAAATRRQLADMVLKLRDADREVAAAIEEALGKLVAKFDGPTVKREGDRVCIDGVPTLRWGTRKECTFAGAMEAALSVTGQPQPYGDIAMDSGLAFRLRWYQGREGQKWCPSTPIGEMGEEWELWAKQSGWQIRAVHDGGDKSARIPEITASIDAGQPVVAYDKGLNMAVLTGYEDHGTRIIAHLYGGGGDPPEQVLTIDELGFLFFFPGSYTQPAPRRSAVEATLRLILRNWSRAPLDIGKGAYVYGADGLKAWAGDLARAEALTEEERRFLFFVNWWTFSVFEDLARFQRPFLERAGSELGSAAGTRLGRAAEHCDHLGPLFAEVFGQKTAFLGPWSGKGSSDWTPEVRQREQEILLAIQSHLGAAVAEIEQALRVTDAHGNP